MTSRLFSIEPALNRFPWRITAVTLIAGIPAIALAVRVVVVSMTPPWNDMIMKGVVWTESVSEADILAMVFVVVLEAIALCCFIICWKRIAQWRAS